MTKPKRKEAHVVLDGSDFVCLNCGTRYAMKMPCPIGVWGAAAKQFDRDHKACTARPNKERDRVDRALDPASQMAAEEWPGAGDAGVSSATIWSVMMGRPSPLGDTDVPHDPADFGRCYRLLKRFPKWRERLPEVAEKHPDWAPLIARWDDVEALFEKESKRPDGMARETYRLIKDLLWPNRDWGRE